jgi:hypothetical protein
MALVSACTRPATTQRGRAPSPRGDKRARTQVRKRHHRKRGQAAPRIVPDSGHAGLASGRGDELTMNLPAADPLLPGLCGGHWHRAHADSAAYSLARLTMPRRAARRRSPIGNELRRRGRHPETSGQFGQSVGSTVQPWKLLQHNDIRAAKTVAAQHTPTPPKILEWGPLDSRDEGRDFFYTRLKILGAANMLCRSGVPCIGVVSFVVLQWVSRMTTTREMTIFGAETGCCGKSGCQISGATIANLRRHVLLAAGRPSMFSAGRCGSGAVMGTKPFSRDW